MSDARFVVSDTALAGLRLVERRQIEDDRGFFSRLYCRDELRVAGFAEPVAQINRSLTRKAGAVRGMHFQHAPSAEDKMVSCLRGAIFDVAVDVREGSPTFLQWHGETLSADNQRSLVIPKGFAHGFQTLVGDCELLYFHTAAYDAAAEGGLNPLDPALSIAWPLPVSEMSPRDRAHPHLTQEFSGFEE